MEWECSVVVKGVEVLVCFVVRGVKWSSVVVWWCGV